MEYYNDAAKYFKYFNIDEDKDDQINYRLLSAAEDCLNLSVLQFEKMDAIEESLDKYEEDSIRKKLAFLEYYTCIETFINQTNKFYLLMKRLARRFNSEEMKKIISEHEDIIISKIRDYRNAQEHYDERIENDHSYVSQRGTIIDGVIKTEYGTITTDPKEATPLKCLWSVTIEEVERYIEDRRDRVNRIHAAFQNRPID